jgi:hypothetical protein
LLGSNSSLFRNLLKRRHFILYIFLVYLGTKCYIKLRFWPSLLYDKNIIFWYKMGSVGKVNVIHNITWNLHRLNHVIGLSEWLLFNATWTIFQLYHGENKLHQTRWWWPLYNRPTLVWLFVELAHCINSSRVDMLHNSDTILM